MTLRVLVVDDEALARSRLIRLLGDCTTPGVLVVGEAADAAQAMQCVQQQQLDVVLADIQMPGVDGLSLAATACELCRTRRLWCLLPPTPNTRCRLLNLTPCGLPDQAGAT
jgi:two-component system response regulator AlgR